ncbi:hypothetical protein D3C78_1920350 [compost metagenome]
MVWLGPAWAVNGIERAPSGAFSFTQNWRTLALLIDGDKFPRMNREIHHAQGISFIRSTGSFDADTGKR